MNRFYIRNGECGVEKTFQLVSSRYRPRIMDFCRTNGGASYREIKEQMPDLTDATLSRSLRVLVKNNLLQKRVSEKNSARYYITQQIRDLIPALEKMQTFAVHCGYDEADGESSLEYTKLLIGNKWDSRIIWMIHKNGNIRFNELRRGIEGLTHKVLTDHLDNLIDHRLVERIDYQEKSPHVEYRLTETGEEAYALIKLMAAWAIKYELIRPTIYIQY